MGHHAEVIIVGGGVIGGSVAYHLAKRGRRVKLLERERVGAGASGAAAGMLGAQSEMHEAGPLYELARRSRAMFPQLDAELRELTGIDIGLVQRGLLKIARTPDEAEEIRRMIDFQVRSGEAAQWLGAGEACELEPELAGSIEGAMWIPGDGHVSAPELTAAYAHAAVTLGAELYESSVVHELRIEGGRVTGVVTDEGVIGCEQLVVAGGVSGNRLCAQAGLRLDMYPVKGECFSVITRRPLVSRTIFANGCYAVPKRGGRLVIGATVAPRDYGLTVSAGGLRRLLDSACSLLPAIADAQWEKSWAGHRPQTPDGLPYMGESASCRGLFVAAGHYRNGILLSAAAGELMAEQMCGEPVSFEAWNAFAPDRRCDAQTASAGALASIGGVHGDA
ncbi:glycine oxidase ThiO [Paenibacillus chartarius]|uniref:glycine oxidase n=1 Tax=Paenibacillus chartarius TaxID=747481 RepID=A0ABV6DPG3_9BACL